MRTAIDVVDRAEAEAIRAALADPTTRALVVVLGSLMPLSRRAQARVLGFVSDKVDEWRTEIRAVSPAEGRSRGPEQEKDLESRGDGVPGVGQGDLPRLLEGVISETGEEPI